MKVSNVHERLLAVSADRVGEVLDLLGSDRDMLWPRLHWPAMRLDAPARVGYQTGHGPIRYRVDAYDPGRRIRFRFTAPRGFDGTHEFEVVVHGPCSVSLRHRLDVQTRGIAVLSWPLVIRPIHDALIEDALDNASRACSGAAQNRPWSWWVRLLRAAFRLDGSGQGSVRR